MREVLQINNFLTDFFSDLCLIGFAAYGKIWSSSIRYGFYSVILLIIPLAFTGGSRCRYLQQHICPLKPVRFFLEVPLGASTRFITEFLNGEAALCGTYLTGEQCLQWSPTAPPEMREKYKKCHEMILAITRVTCCKSLEKLKKTLTWKKRSDVFVDLRTWFRILGK